jgi:metal-responsive CopG/Arc/MetJ family transcriptional regulator
MNSVSMPDKRAANKIRVTVPMEDVLLARIEAFAKEQGIDRVAAMKLMCDSYLTEKTKSKKTPKTK